MRGNIGKNTTPEIELRRLLWQHGVRGYRLHWPVAGRPDIAFPGRKVAVFVNGCFWHRCPRCALALPRTNTEYWQRKFALTIERDSRKEAELRADGWRVLTVWECELRDSPLETVRRIQDALQLKAPDCG